MLTERLLDIAEHGNRVADIADRKGMTKKAARLRAEARAIQRTVSDIRNGDIGEPIRHVDLPGEEPVVVPEEDPVPEKVPA